MARHVKCAARSDPAYGCRPEERDIREHIRWGVVLLDKPSGPTSRQAAEAVRTLLGAAKAGHGGTLDPKVTGVLPVLLERSTRVAGVLLGCDKVYTGRMRLHGDVTDEQLAEALVHFQGVLEQVPPRRSRVKRRVRRRFVRRFEVVGRDGRSAEFYVDCESGTYVRKLIHDLGQALGCGAHMVELRRLRAGPFAVEECIAADSLEQAVEVMAAGDDGPVRRVVRSVEEVVARVLPRLWLDDGAVHSVCTGFPLAVPGVCALEDFEQGQRVALMTMKGELIGLGEAQMGSAEILREHRGIAAVMKQVLMRPDVYPKYRPERR